MMIDFGMMLANPSALTVKGFMTMLAPFHPWNHRVSHNAAATAAILTPDAFNVATVNGRWHGLLSGSLRTPLTPWCCSWLSMYLDN